jgi:AcrR family transcriptional regulator
LRRSVTASEQGEKKQEKLTHVLTIAGELFAGSDFQHVCMEDIAQRAGVGKGTLYNLFSSKEDLYFSIIRERLSELLGILERTYDGRHDTLRNLRSFILHLHKFMSKYPHFYLLWKREEASIVQNDRLGIGELHGQIRRTVLRVLARGGEEAVIRPGLDHELLADVLLGMVDALRKSPAAVFTQERAIEDLFEILVRGIGVPGIDPRVTYDRYEHQKDGSAEVTR